MLLNYIGKPSLYLPICMMLWGAISCLTGRKLTSLSPSSSHDRTGAARNFKDALITRFFIGFVEAAFFPGALFLLSKWYKRSELGLRTALLSCGILISNAFGSLMASGILGGMQGNLDHASWRSVALMPESKALSPMFSLQVAFLHRGHADDPGRYHCCIRTSRFSSELPSIPLSGGNAARQTPHARRRRHRRWR
jgi:MFS family permease